MTGKAGAGQEGSGKEAGVTPAASDVSSPQSWIFGGQAEELKRGLVDAFPLLQRAATYKDDQRVLDASADVVELPDGTFRMREE